jgi:RNA polymerase sigma factor (sigma-70 family)
VRAFRSLDRFDWTRPLRPWLMRITMNQARNRRRSVGRYLVAVERWFRLEGRLGTTSGASPESPLTHDDAAVLREAVSKLNRRDQEVVYIRFFLGLGEAEAAATLAVPEGTVKSRLSRALARLRIIVEREYPGLREALRA